MNNLPGALELLSSRVDELEKRVYALEHPREVNVHVAGAPLVSRVALATEESEVEQASGVFAVLGKGMLGIAGAYVLRAVAESGALPKLAVAAVAIAYAIVWMVWAAWLRGAGKLVQVIFAGTSAVILTPMLWELTLHFKALSPSAAAAILGVYGLIAALLDWKHDAMPVVWVAHSAAAAAALFLGIATHVLLPFIATLLLLVALSEYAATRKGGAAIRPLVILASDLAIWGLIFIYSGPKDARAEYPNLDVAALIAPAWALWTISAVSLTVKTVIRHRAISVFEAIQAMLAFALAVWATLLFAPSRGSMAIGLVCLLLAVACYVTVFRQFLPSGERRNLLVFGGWSAALVLGGAMWCLPAGPAAVCLAAASFAASFIGARMQYVMLELHGAIFLVAAAVLSRLPQFAFRELAGSLSANPGSSLIVVSLCAVLCYAASRERKGEGWRQQVLHLIPALLSAFALAAFTVQSLLGLASSQINLDLPHVAFIRTLTLCAISAAFAFGGSRWTRLEMTRIAYATLAFVAAKLLFEDLRHARMEFIAGSIFLFALTLIAVPRMAHARREARAAPQAEAVLQKRG